MNGKSSKPFGKEIGLLHEVLLTAEKVGAGRNFWKILAHDEKMFKRVVELVNARPTFDIIVDYDQAFQKMIEVGNYDYVNNYIKAEHFPVEGSSKQKKIITLLRLDKTMTSDEVKAEMEKQGFCPAKIEDLLVLGEIQPELQKQFPIVALGSVWQDPDDDRYAPCLGWGGVGRSLGLYLLGGDWSANCRFVALRK